MRFSTRKRRRTPTVIIVSLIDVLLVVLIFLMITTTAKKAEPALKLNLPQSREAKTGPSETKPFVILVNTNFPYFFLGDRPVTLDRLQIELAMAVKQDPQLQVLVRADRAAPFGEVIHVVDALKATKVAAINFVTEKQVK